MGGPGSGRKGKGQRWKSGCKTRQAMKTFSVYPEQQELIEQHAKRCGYGDARGAGFAPAGRELIEIGYRTATKKKG